VNGAHDLGGMQGFGPVVAEPEGTEPVFHAEWERDVAAAAMATFRIGRWSLDEFRRNIESQRPVDYLNHTYYENWLASVSKLFVNHGIATPEELASGHSSTPVLPPARTWTASFAPPAQPPVYGAGAKVRAVNRHPRRHTRQPRYIRGRVGSVVRHVGAEPLPEEAAEGVCRPQHLYLVRFEAAELWGPDAGGRDAVYIELWESYLEPAT
jgi:nitrile hydratase